MPILAPKNTDPNSTEGAFGFTFNTHTIRISVSKERVEAIRRILDLDRT